MAEIATEETQTKVTGISQDELNAVMRAGMQAVFGESLEGFELADDAVLVLRPDGVMGDPAWHDSRANHTYTLEVSAGQ